MASRWFGSKRPRVPHLLGRRGLGGEIADLREDLGLTFDSLEVELDALIAGGLITEVGALENPLVLTGSAGYLVSGPVDIQSIAFAPTGHVDGATALIFIEADALSSDDGLHLPPNLELRGDAFDSTSDWLLAITHFNGRFSGISMAYPPLDVAPPTLSSASVAYTNQNAITLNFSKDVIIRQLSGITLAFSVGTARTITAVETGDGTGSVTLTLSGNVSASDVLTVSIAAQSVQDLNGSWLAPVVAQAVTNNVGDPVFAGTFIFFRGDNLGADGSSVTTWTDQSGQGNNFTQATAGERPTVLVDATLNNQKVLNFDGTDDSLYNVTGLLIGGSAAPDSTSYTVLIVWKHDGTTSDIPFSFSDNSSVEFTHLDFVRDAGTLGFYGGSSSNGATLADSSTVWRFAWGIHRGASRDLYINAALAGTSAVAVNPNAIKYGRIGRGIQTGAYPFDGKIAELRVIDGELSAGNLTDWRNYVQTRYGL